MRNKRWAAPALCALGLIMMAYGVINGESAIVLRKAVRICLECIGVG